jgi:aminopeptidase N
VKICADSYCCHRHRPRVLPSGGSDKRESSLDGVGDPYFPKLGNGGYDALHYDLKLQVDPKAQHLVASTKMHAKALRDLAEFNLDFRNFDISKVVVNGKEASYRREDGELIVRPEAPLEAGQDFSVGVDYSGKPQAYHSPHAPIPIGWNATKDGSYVLSEPDGSSTWYPVNDHPRDKASYTFDVTVPKGYQAVCNGKLVEQNHTDTQSNYKWDAKDPMASYLSTVNVGKFVQQDSVGPNGVPIHNFFPPRIAKLAEFDFGRVPQMMEWFGQRFGNYPFEVYGGLVLDASVGGAALETQTRPVFEKGMVTGTRATEFVIAHELAHHWWGNSTSVKDWKDIWLSEGFANYSHLMWRHEYDLGKPSLDKAMQKMYNKLPKESEPVADPGENQLFSQNVYERGAVTLHVLRRELGDEKFFETLRTYSQRYRNSNVSTSDFVGVVDTLELR